MFAECVVLFKQTPLSTVPISSLVFTATMVVCELPASEIEVVKPGMKVRLGDETGQVGFIYTSGENLSVLFDMDKPVLSMPDGEYDATLVLESRTPISFLLN